MWGYNNIGSSPDPSSEIYRGTAAFSEPETQVLRDFCNNHNFNIEKTHLDNKYQSSEQTDVPVKVRKKPGPKPKIKVDVV